MALEHLDLDLHGIKHNDAEASLIRVIEEHRGEPIVLRIITGNSEQMKGIVKNILNEYDLKYTSLVNTEVVTWIK